MKNLPVSLWIASIMLIFSLADLEEAKSALTAGPDIITAPALVIDDPPGAVNDHQQAFDERQGVVLSAPLQVDGGTIPAGSIVNSHMIFLNTEEGSASDRDMTWKFDGPILGVMSDIYGTLEAASSSFLGWPATIYPSAFYMRGMESNDYYSVSGDTIKVTMGVGEPGDWIRVITKNRESDVKWNQPPDMEYGVNLRSTFTVSGTPQNDERWIADDWQCRDPRPITDVHFWGSYIGWRDRQEIDPSLPPPGVNAFVIRFYTDIPQETDPDMPYSHPGELLYEATITDFSETFIASIPHTDATGNISYEHKFAYDIDLSEPFRQEEGTVYWISIAAIMEDTQFPWGWESSTVHWNDNACRFWAHNLYWDDINPDDDFEIPSWYPHERVDMAFALTVEAVPHPPVPEPIKWQQRPDMKAGVNIKSDPQQRATVADDWLCLDGSPVTALHFWGSYPGWQPDPEAPATPPGVKAFRIQIYSDVPASGPDSFSRPGHLLYETWVEEFMETYVGPIELPWGEIEHKFRYDMELPRIFWQKQGTVYWLNISAIPKENRPWGWESSMDRWNDVAVQGWYEDTTTWWWNTVNSPAITMNFEDVLSGTYAVGDSFTSTGIPVFIKPFRRWDGTWNSGGYATVDNLNMAGGSGNEINTNNANMNIVLPAPATHVSFLFGEYGGYNNLMINGQIVNFENYHDIDGQTVGGIQVSVVNGNGQNSGTVNLHGHVNQLAIGGQELFVDSVTFSKPLNMSFELSTCEGPIKWLQFPDMAQGVNISSAMRGPVVADDFLCTNGRPITEVHFWGSFLDQEQGHWAQDIPKPPTDMPIPKVERFKLSFHRDVPAGADQQMPWSHPGELLKEVHVDNFEQIYWDSIPHTDATGRIWWEHKFYYIIKLRDEARFLQKKGEIYWLDVGALMAEGSNFHWGWETSKDHWNDAAVSGDGSQWNPLTHISVADFEDMPSTALFNVNDTFDTDGVSVAVGPFRYWGGTLDFNGNASVSTEGCSGGSGQEMQLSVVNLAFEFPCEPHHLQMDVGHEGGLLNLTVNGEEKTFEDFHDIDVQIIAGVLFVFDDPDNDGKGKLSLKGPIYNFSIGGQELCIDNIEYDCKSTDMAFALITEDDTPYCEGDFDRDGDVDGKDLTVFIKDFNRTDCHDSGDCEGDFNYDGSVKDDDFAVFAPDYGRQDCPCAMPKDCDDNDPCTDDFIDPATMQCTHRQICEACCLADAICDYLPIDECVRQGGKPMGQGSNCTTTQCSSAVEHDEDISFPVNELILYAPSLGSEIISLSGPMAMDVYFEGPAEGDAQDDDGNGLDEVKTQVVSLDLHGINPVLGPITLKLNPAFDSIGEIEETENLLAGRLDVPPFGPEGSVADSFFDVFVEIEVAGQKRHSNTPLRFAGTITYKPLGDSDVFWCSSTEPVELFNEAGISTGETLGCIEPKGACCIAGRCIALTKSECVAREGEYKGPGTECAIGLCEQ